MVLIFIEVIVTTLRLYSRTFLIRSVGSDEFHISIGFVRFTLLIFPGRWTADGPIQVVSIARVVSDLQSFRNGWAQHESDLTSEMYVAQQKW